MRAIYPGTFDPITNGHFDVIQRASAIFDEVIVAIMKNPKKNEAFTPEERKEMIERVVKDLPNVRVVIGSGLTAKYAKSLECQCIIRGIRAVADYEYELAQASGNMVLEPSVETMFMVAKPEYSFLSSSIAKEVATLGGDISTFIPEEIIEDVLGRLRK